jgi:sec-independent protein translocase protein TatA
MLGDLFDSPWKILIVAVVIIVLFGSAKLPLAARSLGKSMRILKTEVHGLHNDEPEDSAPATTVQAAPAPVQPVVTQPAIAQVPSQQEQIEALQRQLSDLQQQNVTAGGTVPADAPSAK